MPADQSWFTAFAEGETHVDPEARRQEEQSENQYAFLGSVWVNDSRHVPLGRPLGMVTLICPQMHWPEMVEPVIVENVASWAVCSRARRRREGHCTGF